MTRINEEYTETVTRKREVKAICDKCGDEIQNPDGQGYEDRDFTLEKTAGDNYGAEGADIKGWGVEDLCDPCAESLKMLLIANGYKITPIDREW